MIVWLAGHNVPGSLPENEPDAFDNRLDAVTFMADELNLVAEQTTIPGEYEEAAESLRSSDASVDGDWERSFSDGYVYWVSAEDVTEEEAAEWLSQD